MSKWVSVCGFSGFKPTNSLGSNGRKKSIGRRGGVVGNWNCVTHHDHHDHHDCNHQQQLIKFAFLLFIWQACPLSAYLLSSPQDLFSVVLFFIIIIIFILIFIAFTFSALFFLIEIWWVKKMAEVCAGVRTHSLVGWLVGEFPSQFRFARSNKPTCLCVCGEFWLNFLNPKFVKYTHVLYVCKNSPYKSTYTWFPSLFSWFLFSSSF